MKQEKHWQRVRLPIKGTNAKMKHTLRSWMEVIRSVYKRIVI